ncbi:uncharacterized protein LOC111717300 [Eurytemora carolleeae]|uniref:uncharacterized protein LOC111717300 n=1 Tax=Eurytemora carolleeae TaxID=1294199 RepID=UPI000C77DD4C|nr:uncharacterized protein LOC111717300 [Eurytemora carolleeae]|eukprot:XP_023348568.1 uncharacterized protein LOC111717300 [Eurytemora affinis]
MFAERMDRVCLFFSKGTCWKGKDCPFLHILPRSKNRDEEGEEYSRKPPYSKSSYNHYPENVSTPGNSRDSSQSKYQQYKEDSTTPDYTREVKSSQDRRLVQQNTTSIRESRSQVKRRDRNPRYSPSSQNNRYSINFNLDSIISNTLGPQVNHNH